METKHYAFKEMMEDGVLVTPMSDPNLYEFPFDFQFPTAEQAEAVLAEWVDDYAVDGEEAASWLLVKVTYEVIDRG